MTKGRAVTIIPNGEGSRGFFRLRPQTGEKLYSKANRERKKKAEAVKSEAISRRTKRRLSKPKRKLGAGGRGISALWQSAAGTQYNGGAVPIANSPNDGQPCGHIRGVQAARYTSHTQKRKDTFTG